MLRIDAAREEPIRRWPVRLARLLNRFIGWTPDACYGGCGYPVTYRFSHDIEVIGGARVYAALCSTGGLCEQRVSADPRDQKGQTYADYRPGIVLDIQANPDVKVVRLTYNA